MYNSPYNPIIVYIYVYIKFFVEFINNITGCRNKCRTLTFVSFELQPYLCLLFILLYSHEGFENFPRNIIDTD